MKHWFWGICLIIFTSSAAAQRGFELGGWMGAAHYFGDLNTTFRVNHPGFAGGLIARYNFNNRLCFKLSGNFGQVSADDADSKNAFERARNLSFKTSILEATGQFEFNFLPYNHGSRDEWFTPYLFAGVTTFSFNPMAEFEGQMVELRELGTEGQFRGEEYYTIMGAIAYGGGFKMDLSYEWSLNIELSARKLFTDYLDDVSTVYPDMDDLENLRGDLAVKLSDRSIIIPGVNEDRLGQAGIQRGNSSTNDSYAFLEVGLVYYFGNLRCPTYGNRKRK